MERLKFLQDLLSSTCGKGWSLQDSYTQRTIMDAINLVFLLVYCLSLIMGTLQRGHTRRKMTRFRDFMVVSASCVVTGLAYFVVAVVSVLDGSDMNRMREELIILVRVIVWFAVAISMNIQPTMFSRIVTSIWWAVLSLIVTVVNVTILIIDHHLLVIDIIQWPASLLLLLCGIRFIAGNLVCHKSTSNDLNEPLVSMKTETKVELGAADFFSRMTFSWINPLLRTGYSKSLDSTDIPSLDCEDSALKAYRTFARVWDRQMDKPRTKNAVIFALGKCYTKEMLIVGMYALVKAISVSVSPLLLYAFVQYSSRTEKDNSVAIFLVIGLVVVKVIESLSQRHWFFDSRRYGMRMRSALMDAVFQKQLKLSSHGRKRHSMGEIVNYIAVDAYRLGDFPWWFHMAWSLPLQLCLSLAVIFGTVGWGALPGLVPLLICGLLNIPFARILEGYQSKFMVAQDERLRATSAVLNNMKIIKLQSWGDNFINTIKSLRNDEIKWLTEIQVKKAYGSALYWMSPTIVSAVILAGTAIMGTAPLNATTIFTILATLRVMSEPVRMLPEVIMVMIQVKISLERIAAFLLEDEIKEDVVRRNPAKQSDISIELHNGFFSWDPTASNPTLKKIDLSISIGQKIAICGPVGAGKSSLLHAILGEIPKISGSVDLYGSIAYVSQISWIQSGTIRDNILYGKPMNKIRYDRAIESCALDKDIENFIHGDLTEIGQRGLNMSGGQKQRIQLARAVYCDADIYLLDDPFSAVDAHTAAILFHDCVMSALAKKTVILVTHQVEFLPETDRILVLENGEVSQSGSYEDLLKLGTAFEELVNAHQLGKSIAESVNHERSMSDFQLEPREIRTARQPSENEISIMGSSTNQLTEDEEKETGYAGWRSYKFYFYLSKNCVLLFFVVASQLAFVILQMLSTYWLALEVQMQERGKGIYVGVYAAVSTLSCLFAYLRSFFGAKLGLKASNAFFSGFTDSVFRAPMLFFDSTPVGRILTRASSDMSILDFDIPYSITFLLTGIIEIVMAIIVMATVTWQVLIVAVPTMFVVAYVQIYYLASARELVRINGTTKAPIMNYIGEAIFGLVTIRAFGTTERFINTNQKFIDTDATMFFHTNAAMEWILLRVETLQNLIILTLAIFLVLLPQGSISPGFTGLSLTYALAITGTQVFCTRWYSNMENYIISVERIKKYMHIPPEEPLAVDNKRAPSLWPEKGKIEFQALEVRYNPNAPFVLKGINCDIKAGDKVGVVGRTGSGKTTLISTLFRLVEPAGGRILIDGIDICSVDLKSLRMKLSIIPQEPTLFRGSIRSNLDPLNIYTDHEIWKALEKCQLKFVIGRLPAGLDSSVSDDGENWSVGQRQLFCLGRVLLRKNMILVLDEATASIDSATDVILQSTIRREFSTCTTITIAHRVPTVTDSDMVMVLSYGKLVEYDNPSRLVENHNSYFSKLVAEYWSN